MCVICHAAKKRHIKREEVEEAMRNNSSGFCMVALHGDGTREVLRTLERKAALDFFDGKVKEEDEFVMHARIPSVGEVAMDNVHGWEEDGILFMHNMTIRDIDDMIKRVSWKGTDSEFFFRKIFIPFYRGLGDQAYKDGKFHPDLDNLVEHFVGYSNKFCFIMPDNRVLRYGSWVDEPDRKENGETAFHASNGTYRVKAWKGVEPTSVGSFRRSVGYDDFYGLADYYDDDYPDWRRSRPDSTPVVETRPARPVKPIPWERKGTGGKAKKEKKGAGETLLKLAGPEGVCRIALQHLVFENVKVERARYTESEEVQEDAKKLNATVERLMPGIFRGKHGKELFDTLEESFGWLSLPDTPENDVELSDREKADIFIKEMAEAYEDAFRRTDYGNKVPVSETMLANRLETFNDECTLFRGLCNVDLDFEADSADDFVTAFVMVHGLSGRAEMEEIGHEDIITVSTQDGYDTLDSVDLLLDVINGRMDEREDVVASLPAEDDGDIGLTVTAAEIDKLRRRIGQDPDAKGKEEAK